LKRLLSVVSLGVLYSALSTPVFATEQLMEKKGCISCHRVDQKLIGPAFKAIAAKYKGTDARAELFEKVREGGEGVWGDMPMPPNEPSKVSDEDLKTIIDWILHLQ
jgi:cytochrome c